MVRSQYCRPMSVRHRTCPPEYETGARNKETERGVSRMSRVLAVGSALRLRRLEQELAETKALFNHLQLDIGVPGGESTVQSKGSPSQGAPSWRVLRPRVKTNYDDFGSDSDKYGSDYYPSDDFSQGERGGRGVTKRKIARKEAPLTPLTPLTPASVDSDSYSNHSGHPDEIMWRQLEEQQDSASEFDAQVQSVVDYHHYAEQCERLSRERSSHL